MKIEVDVPDDLLSILALIERARTLAAPGTLKGTEPLRAALTATVREARSVMTSYALVSIEESR